MKSLERKNFEKEADEVSIPNNARIKTVNAIGQKVIKLTVQPGWKWSQDIKPIFGIDSCQAKHIGLIIEGTITCKNNNRGEITYSAGDAYAIELRHDAWIVGDMPAVAYEFHGAWDKNYYFFLVKTTGDTKMLISIFMAIYFKSIVFFISKGAKHL